MGGEIFIIHIVVFALLWGDGERQREDVSVCLCVWVCSLGLIPLVVGLLVFEREGSFIGVEMEGGRAEGLLRCCCANEIDS